ncbi:MAG: hypothetical protein RL701_1490 [Pseudomonadota bacterium]|jgi:glycosyltransferase involved in cell wall biosynthesis
MLTLQLLVPRSLPARVRNTDLLQNIDLGLLGEFVTGGRKLRCVFEPLVAGQASVLAPLVAARGLSWGARRFGLRAPEELAQKLYGACFALNPDPRADVVLGHGLLPILPIPGRRPRAQPGVLWGPGYVHDDCYVAAPSASEKSLTDARLRALSAAAGGIFLTTDDAVARWNRHIGTPSSDHVFTLPLFLPRAPRSTALPARVAHGQTTQLLFVGREARRKNLPALIAAIDSLGPVRSLRLTIVSDFRDGPVDIDRPYILHHNSLPNHVVLEAMQRSDILAMISQRETFGVVFVEALAYGCTVLAPERTAQRDMLGPSAVYAQPDSVESIAAALDELLGGGSARFRERAEVAQARYARRFAPDVVANAFFDAAQRVAAGGERVYSDAMRRSGVQH